MLSTALLLLALLGPPDTVAGVVEPLVPTLDAAPGTPESVDEAAPVPLVPDDAAPSLLAAPGVALPTLLAAPVFDELTSLPAPDLVEVVLPFVEALELEPLLPQLQPAKPAQTTATAANRQTSLRSIAISYSPVAFLAPPPAF